MADAPPEDLVALADAHLREVLTDPKASRSDKMAASLAIARRIPISPPPKTSSQGGGSALHIHVMGDGSVHDGPPPAPQTPLAASPGSVREKV
jgi:hypothetical protein